MSLPTPEQMRKELSAAGWRLKGGYWTSPAGVRVLALNAYMPWKTMRVEGMKREASGATERRAQR